MRHARAITIAVSSLLLFGRTPGRPPVGIRVTPLHRGPDPLTVTDADGLYVMKIESKDVVLIRKERIRVENVGRRLQELFQTRVERLLLVRVEGLVTFGDVIEVLDRASSRVQLQYGLLTERSTPTPAEPSLFMHGNFIYTQYFPAAAPPPLSSSSPK